MLKILVTALMVALVVWSIVRILDQRRAAGTSTALRQEPRRAATAPDDDPEFLWRLEREQRRARKPQAEPGRPGAARPEQGGPDHGTTGQDRPDAPQSDETGDSAT